MLKEEFEKLLGRNVSEKDYEKIQYVYTWHPSISETDGKKQIVDLYRNYGMAIIEGMITAAFWCDRLDYQEKELQRKLLKIKDRKERIKNGDFELEECIDELQKEGIIHERYSNSIIDEAYSFIDAEE